MKISRSSRSITLLLLVILAFTASLIVAPAPASADNDVISVFSSATRTTSEGSGHATYGHRNKTHRGVKLIVDVDSVVGGGSVDCKVQTRDAISGSWVDLTSASTGADTAGTTELTIYPGIAETANVSISDVIPYEWRVYATIVTSATFSVTGNYID